MLAWSSGVRWGSSPVPHPCIRHSWDTTRSRHYQSTFKGSRSSRLYLHIACAAVDTQPIRTGCEISSLTNRGRLKRLFWWTKYINIYEYKFSIMLVLLYMLTWILGSYLPLGSFVTITFMIVNVPDMSDPSSTPSSTLTTATCVKDGH